MTKKKTVPRIQKIKRFSKLFIDSIKESTIPDSSAQIAYYLVLSIFPFIIFFLNILSYIPISTNGMLDKIVKFLPDEAEAIIKVFLDEISVSFQGTLLSITILVIIWSGSRGIYSIIKGINKAYGLDEPHQNIIFKILSLAFTVVLSLLIIVVLITLVFGEIIGSKLFRFFNASDIFIQFWNILRIVIPIAAMVLIFDLLFKFSVSLNKHFKVSFFEALPGAIFTSIGWIISSAVFSFYINNFSKYSTMYGSLGGFIILLLWLYMTAFLILLGGEINAAYKKYKILYIDK